MWKICHELWLKLEVTGRSVQQWIFNSIKRNWWFNLVSFCWYLLTMEIPHTELTTLITTFTRLYVPFSQSKWCPYPWQSFSPELDDFYGPFPTQAILWFYDFKSIDYLLVLMIQNPVCYISVFRRGTTSCPYREHQHSVLYEQQMHFCSSQR